MKIMITGPTGQLGSEIVKNCRENNYKVIPMRRMDADLVNGESVDKFIRQYRPTHIIHCAAMTQVDDCESMVNEALQINGEATARIVMNAERVGAHVTYISTDYVFNGERGTAYREDDVPNPINMYGATKLSGESTLRPSDAVVRVSWLFGKNGRNIVKTIIDAAKNGTELNFVNDQVGSPTFAEDAASTILQISTQNKSGIWHVTNQGIASWHQFAVDVIDIAKMQGVEISAISSDQLRSSRPARRPRYSVLENYRLSTEEGFELLPHYRDALGRLIPTLS